MLHSLSLAIAILIGVIGQIFLKQAALAGAEYGNNLVGHLQNFSLWLGLFFYGLSTLFYLFALQKIPLSIAYPSLAIGYIFVLLASKIFFKETINFTQLFAVGLIVLGVSLLWQK